MLDLLNLLRTHRSISLLVALMSWRVVYIVKISRSTSCTGYNEPGVSHLFTLYASLPIKQIYISIANKSTALSLNDREWCDSGDFEGFAPEYVES